MDSTYSGTYGKLKAYYPDFLSRQFIDDLISSPNLDDIQGRLARTVYGEHINHLASLYRNPELLEIAVNRELVRKNRIALFAVPPASKNSVLAYLAKWDIENIKSILSSKFMDYPLRESDAFLISFRDVPMGIFAGTLRDEDFKAMLSRGSVEDVINFLSPTPYGTAMLSQIDQYRKTKDLSVLFFALDVYYYTNLLNTILFYNGDEGPVLRLVRELIDVHNLDVLIKGKSMEVEFSRIIRGLIAGGNIGVERLSDLYRSQDVEQIAKNNGQFDLGPAVESFRQDGNMLHFDLEMRRQVYSKYMPVISSMSLSLGSMFHFMIMSEVERENLRTIILGKHYGLSEESLRKLILRW
ncbi:hypothetical protein GCM10007108_00730 [Thermogymnomonas acidicola]|uniref:V/A-type H+-transporting ATPase subunit C n=1 Tax=Thermogymnomonas acidicola TaxID=399579 RepID=A0AA37F8U4_9ARCH|nr:V-type ATPase subunit [Thermogymnomonas acidicola]GGM66402.1 hypothetical protein GCM10007108_00730 [Thermogymnomonas acidicola]